MVTRVTAKNVADKARTPVSKAALSGVPVAKKVVRRTRKAAEVFKKM